MSVPEKDTEVWSTGARVAAWLRQAYPDGRAKRIARDFEASEPAAKSWLQGRAPGREFLERMMRRWGRGFFLFVYGARFDWAAQLELEGRIEALQAALDQVKEGIDAQNAGRMPGATTGLRAGQDRGLDPGARERMGGARKPLGE